MSGGRFLLLFLDDGAAPGWLRLEDGAVTARGREGAAPPPASEGEGERVVAVVPATDVAVHWVDLPALAPAQAFAAARLLAAEVSAEPLERLHVAVDPRGAAGEPRAIAVTSAERMAGWLDRAGAYGLDPDHLVPESLLIDPPASGIRRMTAGDVDIVRGATIAYAAEPEIAAIATDGEVEELIGTEAFEAELGALLAARPLDLRQGVFAKRRRWRVDWRLVRRQALLGGGILLATLLIQVSLILRYSFAADQLERAIETAARRALPQATAMANPPAQLAERLAELRGGGAGFAPSAAAAFAAVRDTPNIDLGSLRFDRSGSLQIGVLGSSAADISALQQRLTGDGFEVTSGEVTPSGGRQMADLTVRPR